MVVHTQEEEEEGDENEPQARTLGSSLTPSLAAATSRFDVRYFGELQQTTAMLP